MYSPAQMAGHFRFNAAQCVDPRIFDVLQDAIHT
jgi:hypothetical protein